MRKLRSRVRPTFVLALVLLALLAFASIVIAGDLPNVIVIISNDQSYGDVAFAGIGRVMSKLDGVNLLPFSNGEEKANRSTIINRALPPKSSSLYRDK